MEMALIEKRFGLKISIDRMKAEVEKIDEMLKAETKKAGGVKDYGVAGCVLHTATRRTIDNEKAKELLGGLQYNQIVKTTTYETFTVYHAEKWDQYKEKFIKGKEKK